MAKQVVDINNQDQYWDSVAWEKTFTHPLNIDLFRDQVTAESRILDYGCGYGRTVNELSNHGYTNVAGIDSSPLMIERGHRMYPHLDLQVLPASGLPYRDESFDVVLLFAVLTCIPTNEGQRKLLHNLTRLLRPGGLIYISDYYLQEDERNLQRYERFAPEFDVYGVFRLPEGTILRHHSVEWIEALTSEFSLIHLSEITVSTMNESSAKGFQYLGKKISFMTPELIYSLRPATPEDFEFVKSLHHANFKDYVTPIWGWDDHVQDRLVRERFDPAKLRVIQLHGKDIGVLQTETTTQELILENIQLLPDYQRRGLGSKIVQNILADTDAAQLPVTLTVLRTNPARSLYERLGFFVTRQDDVRYYMRRLPGSGC